MSLQLVVIAGPDQGKAAVYVDGVKKATFDDYAAAKHLKVARAVKGLKKGDSPLLRVKRGQGTVYVSVHIK